VTRQNVTVNTSTAGAHTHSFSGTTSTNGEHDHWYLNTIVPLETSDDGNHNHTFSGTTSQNGAHSHTVTIPDMITNVTPGYGEPHSAMVRSPTEIGQRPLARAPKPTVLEPQPLGKMLMLISPTRQL
jgi:hypothetical protein